MICTEYSAADGYFHAGVYFINPGEPISSWKIKTNHENEGRLLTRSHLKSCGVASSGSMSQRNLFGLSAHHGKMCPSWRDGRYVYAESDKHEKITRNIQQIRQIIKQTLYLQGKDW